MPSIAWSGPVSLFAQALSGFGARIVWTFQCPLEGSYGGARQFHPQSLQLFQTRDPFSMVKILGRGHVQRTALVGDARHPNSGGTDGLGLIHKLGGTGLALFPGNRPTKLVVTRIHLGKWRGMWAIWVEGPHGFRAYQPLGTEYAHCGKAKGHDEGCLSHVRFVQGVYKLDKEPNRKWTEGTPTPLLLFF
jgi:hypothetical protein